MKTPRSFQVLILSALSLLLFGRADASECFSNCGEGGTPVCGSDGLTYANECDLQYHSCLNPGVLSPEPFDCTLGEAMNTLFETADTSLSGSDGSSSSDADQGSDFPEGPMGGTLSFDEPDFDGIIPGQATKPSDADSSSSSSSSSDGGDDSFPDFDASPTLPPGVVIDPNAPSALDFIPTATLSNDNGKNSEDDHDFFEDTVFDSSIWVVTSKDSSSSSSGESFSESSSNASSGSGGSDDNDASHCEMMCMSRYEPVCASNGATYSNSCELKVAQCSDPKLTFAHPGPCPPYPVAPAPPGGSYDPCAYLCPMFSAPVCSEDGHIYDNKCVYASALCRDSTLEDATAELCETLRLRVSLEWSQWLARTYNPAITQIFQPSMHETPLSENDSTGASRKANGRLTVALSPRGSGDIIYHLCHQSSQSLKTHSTAMKSRLYDELVFLATLLLLLLRVGIVHADYCEECDYSDCPMELDIVCGSDSMSYPNACYLAYESCLDPEVLSPTPNKSKYYLALVSDSGGEVVDFGELDFGGFTPGGIPGEVKNPSSSDSEGNTVDSASSSSTSDSADRDDDDGFDPRSAPLPGISAGNNANLVSTNSSSGSAGGERQQDDGSGDSVDAEDSSETHDFNDFVAENM